MILRYAVDPWDKLIGQYIPDCYILIYRVHIGRIYLANQGFDNHDRMRASILKSLVPLYQHELYRSLCAHVDEGKRGSWMSNQPLSTHDLLQMSLDLAHVAFFS